MTFYIPPVFLFGNKVRHIRNNQEKNKAEYKTATETGIQIENRNIKRIEELEKENTELKEHKENLIWLDKKKDKEIEKLEEENRNLKSELSKFRDSFKKYRDYEKEELAESCYDLARENEKLKEENKWFNKKIKQAGKYVATTMKENQKLQEEIGKLVMK